MNTHTEISNGGPAFPFVMDDDKKEHLTVEWGMSLRDYFAGMALMGQAYSVTSVTNFTFGPPEIAKSCYDLADAMIAARNNP